MTIEQSKKKQFIAGAKCPQCGEMDALVFYREKDKPVRECVECDFIEVLTEEEKEQPDAALNIKIIEL
ncbi:YheV family putative zinc ribbon protein [Kangiella sp. HZ709]|uniref:YheV family putative zinc ribbon protein n=1 Tax=Kangiella sp. HZ709 TaxID=2666328 RepID=UPI0012B0FCE9|nr:YheV family putative zinc ribbon protein [Kangiella sp. HZ709]MRX28022.1 YheV family putative metal-binding protein [Kangiella sp. HZ709]